MADLARTAWVIDTETTGTVEPQVIEFAYAEAIAKPGPVFEIGGAVAQRYKPTKPIELGAMAVHHILPEELESCPPPPERFDLPKFVIGHNVDFDWEALGKPEGVYRIDTCALAREAWPGLDSYKLGALIYHLYPPAEARELLKASHTAYADVHLCFVVFLRALAVLPGPIASWGDVWRASEAARVPKIMPISKEHKGKPIAEVPRDFVGWYMRQTDLDTYLVQAFKNAGLC